MDNVYPMKVSVLLCDKTYEGMLHSYESESNSPHIILAAYLIKDLMGNIIENHSNDDTKVIILNTNSIEKVEIEYHKNSNMRNDLKDLVDSRNDFPIKK